MSQDIQTTIKGGIRFALGNVRDEAHSTEHNDCTVRALKVAAGVPYADAHALAARLGRRNRHGLKTSQLLAMTSMAHVYGYKVTSIGVPMFRGTLGAVMATLRTGRYMIIKTGHAIGCIDGVLYDTGTSGPSSRIKMILKFTPMSEYEKMPQMPQTILKGGF
jgi:hypothetical protein